MAKKVEKAHLGYCPGCDAQILNLSRAEMGKELPNHRQTFFEVSDGTIMRVTVCKDCLEKMDKKLSEYIMARFRLNWKEEVEQSQFIEEDRKGDVIEKQLARKVVDHNVKPRAFIDRHRKSESVKESLHRQSMEELEGINKEMRKRHKEEEEKQRKDKEEIEKEIRKRKDRADLERAKKAIQ